MTKKSNHGGKRDGAGRKPLASEAMVTFTIRLTKEQRDLLLALGGAQWVREKLAESQLT